MSTWNLLKLAQVEKQSSVVACFYKLADLRLLEPPLYCKGMNATTVLGAVCIPSQPVPLGTLRTVRAQDHVSVGAFEDVPFPQTHLMGLLYLGAQSDSLSGPMMVKVLQFWATRRQLIGTRVKPVPCMIT